MINCSDFAPIITSRLLAVNAGLLVIFMTGIFAIAKRRNRLDTVDTAWGLGFIVVALAVLAQRHTIRTEVITALVLCWGIRLSSHLYRRARRSAEDARYTELSRNWRGNKWRQAYLSIYLTQAALIWLVSLPIVMAAGRPLQGWKWLTVVGGLIWVFGFIFEAVADRQLRNFRAQTDHPKVLQTGLWQYSRHPNYFGELVQWWGIGVIALQTSFGWLGLLGPLTLSLLIIFVSGIPPIEKKRRQNAAYRAYMGRTSQLLPLPRRKLAKPKP